MTNVYFNKEMFVLLYHIQLFFLIFILDIDTYIPTLIAKVL